VGFENWSRRQDGSTQTKKPYENDILPGDVVVFTFSHIGLAISAPDENGFVETIEGNTTTWEAEKGAECISRNATFPRSAPDPLHRMTYPTGTPGDKKRLSIPSRGSFGHNLPTRKFASFLCKPTESAQSDGGVYGARTRNLRRDRAAL
jgi:hypothetical protein